MSLPIPPFPIGPPPPVKHDAKIISEWSWNFAQRIAQALNDNWCLVGAESILGLRWRALLTKSEYPDPLPMTPEMEAQIEEQTKSFERSSQLSERLDRNLDEMLDFMREVRREKEERKNKETL